MFHRTRRPSHYWDFASQGDPELPLHEPFWNADDHKFDPYLSPGTRKGPLGLTIPSPRTPTNWTGTDCGHGKEPLSPLQRHWLNSQVDTKAPWSLSTLEGPGRSTVRNDPQRFEILLELSHFSPYDISVKHKGDNIIVHGKHSEYHDHHGPVCRQFTRRYIMPKEVDPDQVACSWSGDTLHIMGPKKAKEAAARERVIPMNLVEVAKSLGEAQEKMPARRLCLSFDRPCVTNDGQLTPSVPRVPPPTPISSGQVDTANPLSFVTETANMGTADVTSFVHDEPMAAEG
ncbi:Alpha-crystallin A chain [Halotydeus destructor]|nr:Alpha-crystallin A chain [Halotydeus destructor]